MSEWQPVTESKKMTRKRRFGYVLLFMALFSVAYQLGTFVEVSEEDAQEILRQFEEIAESIDGVGIFLHNFTINAMMFIPGFGIAWGSLAAFQTGMAFSAFSSIEPMLKDFPALALLYLSPFGLMELFAYGIAMSRSFLILKKLIKRDDSLKSDYKVIGIEVGIVVALLFAGGLLEAYMIEWASSEGMNMLEMLKQ